MHPEQYPLQYIDHLHTFARNRLDYPYALKPVLQMIRYYHLRTAYKGRYLRSFSFPPHPLLIIRMKFKIITPIMLIILFFSLLKLLN